MHDEIATPAVTVGFKGTALAVAVVIGPRPGRAGPSSKVEVRIVCSVA